MKAEIIAIGSELLGPERVDTNSLYITERLNEIGIAVQAKSIVGDDADTLEQSIRMALSRSDLIISTGGLGPTEDDITRNIFAKALGRDMTLSQEIMEGLQRRFSKYFAKMPEINTRQAMVIDGADVLENPFGTAPGLWIEDNGRLMVLLPGPPREMKPMVDNKILPRLQDRVGSRCLVRHVLKIAGLGESVADSMASPVYKSYENIVTTILASPGHVELHITAVGATRAEAERQLAPLEDQLAAVLGDHMYSRRGESLESVVARVLTERGATVAVAESCTGGLIAERLTQTPGSSAYFRGGVVCYTPESKTALGIPADLLTAKGAVSPEVAEHLAKAIRHMFNATLGVSVTGIAGPSGGTPETPVGMVYVGLAHGNKVWHKRHQFPGERAVVRFLASQSALDCIRREFLATV